MAFGQLDYIYTPTRDVAADVAFFTDVLGGHLVFAIEDMGTRVAMVALTEAPPRIMLAQHLDGERPILVYRVDSLDDTMAALERRGWQREGTLERLAARPQPGDVNLRRMSGRPPDSGARGRNLCAFRTWAAFSLAYARPISSARPT